MTAFCAMIHMIWETLLYHLQAIDQMVGKRPSGTTIFTFGLGPNTNWRHLEKLANLSGGEFIHVRDPEENLREHMSTFYNHIAKKAASEKVNTQNVTHFLRY